MPKKYIKIYEFMKTPRAKLKESKIIGKDGETYIFYDFDDILREQMRSKKFRDEFYKEIARLELAVQLRKMRQAKKMTQKNVAEKANMPQSVVARLESGTHSVSVDTLSRVAHVLGKKIRLI
jgi:ribosome-binding protein aMBF1 (putative translation factor)